METLNYIVSELIRFRDARDWAQFHTPENLAKSICIEAAELLECFQWGEPDREKVIPEIADIAIYLLYISHALDIDIIQAICDKIEENGRKYPVNESRGSSKKYTEIGG